MDQTTTTRSEYVRSSAPDSIFAYLDGILRHRESYFTDIFENRGITRQIVLLLTFIILLTGFYGLVMGSYGGVKQMLSAAVKVPLLYLLTLLICFPLLYVINVLMGSKLQFLQTLALILVALALNSVLLGVCAPIVIFFEITGVGYNFLKLLHVAIFALGGVWGMIALWRGLQGMCEKSDIYPRQAIRILQVWILVFGFVGTQMAWSLRPYVGYEGLEWQFIRPQQSDFYSGVWQSIQNLGTEKK